jgi:hypothetical protein
MWVLSVDAGSLLSVVKFDQKKAGAKALAEKHKATDPNVDYMLVRARIKASLGYVVEVLNALSEDIPGYEPPIVESMPSADYKYRTIISRDEWKRYLMFEVDGIDYDSHVKEETVARQPEPKVANLYSALSATWSAWAKLQDTPPYGNKGWSYSKPDCKTCGHRELAHTVKGDMCSGQKDGMWTEKNQKTSTCKCTKYVPKPKLVTPPAPPVSKNQLAIGESAKDPVYPASVYGSDWDVAEDEVSETWDVAEDGSSHLGWCPYWDGDTCICTEDETDPEADNFVKVGEKWVWQEPVAPNETKRQRHARNERNRRRRQKARRGQNVPATS